MSEEQGRRGRLTCYFCRHRIVRDSLSKTGWTHLTGSVFCREQPKDPDASRHVASPTGGWYVDGQWHPKPTGP